MSLHVKAILGNSSGASSEEFVAPRRTIAANDLDLRVAMAERSRQVRKDVKEPRIVVLHVAGAMITQEMIQLCFGFRRIFTSATIDDIDVLARVRVIQANAMLCVLEGTAFSNGVGSAAVAGSGCNNNWNLAWIGSRTQWNVTKDFYMGVDVLYQRLSGLSTVSGTLPNSTFGLTTAANPSGFLTNTDVNNWSFRFRAHRDFYP